MDTIRALGFSTRYFSKQRYSAADVDIPPNLDHFVQYQQISKREEGDEVLIESPTIKPDQFHKGNIVDIRCSFLGVPTTKGRFKFVIHLEGITFLDDGCVTMESGLRKRGFTYEAASIGKRNKVDNMDVEGNTLGCVDGDAGDIT
ncbi:hypothetical protein M422DRAFT_274007 [Sphaerobolus stellatus SS14]|uniref:Uncharacterized protein n=1 Tax=Sphaerobolus stellatus (strain SS14) TaxID=990650 RepID=A0A0C9UIM5_SPHS4|nr:hypothetical protein M422DRAFT_274007 [Sphaerobolus stellatus SS14]